MLLAGHSTLQCIAVVVAGQESYMFASCLSDFATCPCCLLAAGMHVQEPQADHASWLSPQDVALCMLQLLFLMTQLLCLTQSHAQRPSSHSKLLKSLAALAGVAIPENADVSLEQMFQKADVKMQKDVDDMRQFLCKNTEAILLQQDALCLQPPVCKKPSDHCHS